MKMKKIIKYTVIPTHTHTHTNPEDRYFVAPPETSSFPHIGPNGFAYNKYMGTAAGPQFESQTYKGENSVFGRGENISATETNIRAGGRIDYKCTST